MKKTDLRKQEPTLLFKASNGFIIEALHDPEADKPYTDEEWKRAGPLKPAREVLPPAFFEAIEEWRQAKTRGRPKTADPKRSTTLRLDGAILDAFQAGGRGWQSRINAALKEWLKEHPAG